MLNEDEANGLLGQGVLLNLGPDPANGSHSITNRVAFGLGNRCYGEM